MDKPLTPPSERNTLGLMIGSLATAILLAIMAVLDYQEVTAGRLFPELTNHASLEFLLLSFTSGAVLLGLWATKRHALAEILFWVAGITYSSHWAIMASLEARRVLAVFVEAITGGATTIVLGAADLPPAIFISMGIVGMAMLFLRWDRGSTPNNYGGHGAEILILNILLFQFGMVMVLGTGIRYHLEVIETGWARFVDPVIIGVIIGGLVVAFHRALLRFKTAQ